LEDSVNEIKKVVKEMPEKQLDEFEEVMKKNDIIDDKNLEAA